MVSLDTVPSIWGKMEADVRDMGRLCMIVEVAFFGNHTASGLDIYCLQLALIWYSRSDPFIENSSI